MVANKKELIELIKEQRLIHKNLARKKLTHFSTFINDEMSVEWFHKIIYDILDEWIEGKRKKVAIFVPPQHGKSQMSSITTPAKILGMMPKSKVVVCSYSDKLASKFNRGCQDIMSTENFKEMFPDVKLPAKGIETTNELRNNTYFETVGFKGFFKAVSIGGSLTGTPIDFGIIDDPIKDRKQANSQTYRNNTWDWYNDVFKTRLHNESRQLLLFTRWNEDDIAGRLFDPKNKYYNEKEAKEWTVLVFQALKEDDIPFKDIAYKYEDPRQIGGALWENKHSKEKHLRTKEINPQSFASLNQQRPSPDEGNIIRKEWFQTIKRSELPFNPDSVSKEFFIDGAFTNISTNDETAQMSCYHYKGNLYIFDVHGVRKELAEYLPYANQYLKQQGYKGNSVINIEMKASGYSFYSMLRSPNYGNRNCIKINSKVVSYGKKTRVDGITPILASGRVFLVEGGGGWINPFVEQCSVFPNGNHDDMVDVLCYAVYKYFIQGQEVDVSYS